ncbi:SIMPL domain-containing protein [Nitrosopumilus sp.]|uniref:SIMPL domain-containing protein n=1 Tax=Nitrosopumilus sp. TaxID=2024843 RepID=UPI003B5B0473
MKTSKTQAFAISAVLAAIMIVSAGSVYLDGNAVSAQENTSSVDERLISVTGIATTSVEPDLLVITFGVETQKPTAKEALDSNSQTMNAIIRAIESTRITEDEISTSQFNIYPVYEGYEDPITKRWKQQLVGYEVTNTITVETAKLNIAPDVIDRAVNAGANRVDSVSFTLSPEMHMELKDQLIEQAILNAKAKAENALAPLDYSITGVKAVSLSEFGSSPLPIPMYESAAAFDGEFATKSSFSAPIFSSDRDVSTTANVVFTIGSN